MIRECVGPATLKRSAVTIAADRLAVHQSRRVAMVLGEDHSEGFECCGVLEGFELAEPIEATAGQLIEVERGQVLGVE